MNFRETLLKAAVEAFKANKISRLQLFAIRIKSLDSNIQEQLMQTMAEEAVMMGMMPAGASVDNLAAIDWSQLFKLFELLLPIILKFLV